MKYIFIKNEINMRQTRWLELMADYDLEMNNYPEEVNVVVDALSRKNQATMSYMITTKKELLEELDKLGIEIRVYKGDTNMNSMTIKAILIERIKTLQD